MYSGFLHSPIPTQTFAHPLFCRAPVHYTQSGMAFSSRTTALGGLLCSPTLRPAQGEIGDYSPFA
jgi:hypothetical protein